MNKYHSPFWTIVRKEVADHVRSWRFLILIGIIALTCMGSLYTALTNIGAAIKLNDPDGSFLFLKLFTVSDGTLPSFTVFVSFLDREQLEKKKRTVRIIEFYRCSDVG